MLTVELRYPPDAWIKAYLAALVKNGIETEEAKSMVKVLIRPDMPALVNFDADPEATAAEDAQALRAM